MDDSAWSELDRIHCRLEMHRVSEASDKASAMAGWWAKWSPHLDRDLLQDRDESFEALNEAEAALEDAERELKNHENAVFAAIRALEKDEPDINAALAALEEI